MLRLLGRGPFALLFADAPQLCWDAALRGCRPGRWHCPAGIEGGLQPPSYRPLPTDSPLLLFSHPPTHLLQVAPELKAYYDRLLAKYIPQGVLRW